MNLESPIFSPLDRLFAQFLGRVSGSRDMDFLLAGALTSRFTGQGHVCMPLERAQSESPARTLPEIDRWKGIIKANPLVGVPGEYKPLILNGNNLYLYRYWNYENILVQYLKTAVPFGFQAPVSILDSIFDPGPQREAAVSAVCNRFCVITGGPGTGKTWTAVRILSALRRIKPQRTVLAAPTGKAVARLQASLKESLQGFKDTDLGLIPGECVTLHRLLGAGPGREGFRYHAGNPLPYDTVVVDEASMIDLPLFAKLILALPPEARLILLGDRHQLASVESGAALSDLCTAGLGERVIELKESRRFTGKSVIGRLSGLINDGDGQTALALASEAGIWHSAGEFKAALRGRLLAWLKRYFRAPSPEERLILLDETKILCALNHSAYGVEALNREVERLLREELRVPDERYYDGMPVLILENDYHAGLFNGETGVISLEAGTAMACFRAPTGLKRVPAVRLPGHQAAWCLTVHKSQGSEFGEVILVLPPFDSPVLTRELLYTAVTRAKEKIEIWGEEGVFLKATERRTVRYSGLADLIQE